MASKITAVEWLENMRDVVTTACAFVLAEQAVRHYATAPGAHDLQHERRLWADQERAWLAFRAAVESWEPRGKGDRHRRKETEHHKRDGAEQVEWSCRWIVRGHWRQQWYPAQQRYVRIWIMLHVKGPEDKPIKVPRATVFAVTR